MKPLTKAKIAMAAFLTACLIPSIGMFVLPTPVPAANQRLSPRPRVILPNGALNPNVLRETTDYIADHFGFRQELITLGARLDASVFHVSSENLVALGKDDWLFYRETLDNLLHVSPMSERKLFGAARTLSLLQEYCALQNTEFYVTIAPNKASLYREKLPAMGTPLSGQDDIDRLRLYLEREGVNYIDLYEAFRNQSDVLYYHTDSHWNTRGAALAHDTLLSAMKSQDKLSDAPGVPADAFSDTDLSTPQNAFSDTDLSTPQNTLSDTDLFFSGTYHDGQPHKGDLYEMLYPAGNYAEPDAAFDRAFDFSYVSDYRGPDDQWIETVSPGKSGSLLMFRDSFGNSLHPFLADSYGKAYFSRAMPVQMPLLNDADTVLLEVVERNLRYLAERVPAFPAPQRTPPQNAQPGNASVSVSLTDDGALPGMVRISGVFASGPAVPAESDTKTASNLPERPDTDSPIYFIADGVCYEASPAGREENSFALYLPAPVSPNYTIFYRSHETFYYVFVGSNQEE